MSPAPGTVIDFAVLGQRARLDAPPGPLAARFGRWLDAFPPSRPDAPPLPPGLHYALSPQAGTADAPPWALHEAGTPEPLAQGSPPLLFAALQDSLIWHLGDTDSHALLHAAVLARDGRALVLAGDSHAGKTSLAVTLLRLGFTLLSDEVAALDAEGRAHACAFPLRLRQSARRYLALLPGGGLEGPSLSGALDLDAEPFTHHGEDTLLARVTPPHRALPGLPLPVAAVIWPRLHPPPAHAPPGRSPLPPAPTPNTASPVSARLSPGEAALRLLGAIFNGGPLGERGLDVAAALAKTVPCMTLTGSDLGALGDALAALL